MATRFRTAAQHTGDTRNGRWQAVLDLLGRADGLVKALAVFVAALGVVLGLFYSVPAPLQGGGDAGWICVGSRLGEK